MIPKKAGIYKLTNQINNKIYIGKSKNLSTRIHNHNTCKTNCVISKAIQKYGFNNFNVEILAEFDYYDNTELLALEVAFIDFFQSANNKIGYNFCIFATDRGGIPMSQEQKEKLSKAMKGRFTGKNGSFYGKHHSEETKKIISKIHKGKKISQQRCSEMSIQYKGENNPSFDPTIYKFQHKKTQKIFIGTKFAFYTKFNLHRGNVSQLVLGKSRSVKNWILLSTTIADS